MCWAAAELMFPSVCLSWARKLALEWERSRQSPSFHMESEGRPSPWASLSLYARWIAFGLRSFSGSSSLQPRCNVSRFVNTSITSFSRPLTNWLSSVLQHSPCRTPHLTFLSGLENLDKFMVEELRTAG